MSKPIKLVVTKKAIRKIDKLIKIIKQIEKHEQFINKCGFNVMIAKIK